MLIDREKLIALLVDKTGRSHEEVAEDLDELIARIKEAAKSDRPFHIDDFGTFSMVDGSLHFEPTTQLKTEINQKYAGMKPIELMEAFKETGAGIPVDENGHGSVVPEPPDSDERQEPVSPADQEKEFEEELEQPEPEDEQREEEPQGPPVTAEDEKVPVDEDVSPEPPVQKGVGPEQRRTRPAMKYAKDRGSNAGIITLVIFLVAAISVGGWFLYKNGTFYSSGPVVRSDSELPTDTTEQQRVQPQPSGAEDTSRLGVAAADSAEQTTTDTVSQNEDKTQAADNTPYGLRGSFNEQASNAYTIVIHSFRLRSTVKEIADSLSQYGYRTVLYDGDANGSTRWRIGLGQFKTIENAQEAVQKLPSPYKENHYIQRIRKDNL